MKQLKDYLPLYLGCEGILTTKKTYGSPKRDTVRLTVDILGRLEKLPSMYSFKPILRPLYDMTLSEAREGCMPRDAEELKKIHLTIGTEVINPFLFVWLLSKHFDLFGLIEAGLAIDKTKLTR